MEGDFYCSKCGIETSEDYMVDGECVCEECYFECLGDDFLNTDATSEQQESK